MTATLRHIREDRPLRDDEPLNEDEHEVVLGLGIEEARWLESLIDTALATRPPDEEGDFGFMLTWVLQKMTTREPTS